MCYHQLKSNTSKKIDDELKKSEKLDSEIKEMQNRIKDEKDKKLEQYRAEKKNYLTEKGKKKIPEVDEENEDNPNPQDLQSQMKSMDKDGQSTDKFLTKKKQNCESLLREISVHENKLEIANQKLNEIVAHNNKLREKINVLRKEKNVIEDIYNKLKEELDEKKKNVEKTIKSAGEAYYNRNRAEDELKQLQEKADKQKKDFENECKELNKNIQYDRRFKSFIKSKQKEKEVLEKLEKEIELNEELIKQKKESNANIENEYQVSAKKEEEIKKAFDKIKKVTNLTESKEKESNKLLTVFIDLYQKNTIMSKFVKDLNEEVDELEKKIEEKKKEIQMYQTKGATTDNKRREMKIALTNKIQQEEKKKAILKAQYEKSIETINLIKQYLENVFSAIDVDKEEIEKLKVAAITEENMVHFLGILEKKGLDAIQEYARLIAEQLKLEKGDTPALAQQIDDLNNIIAYENANIMNYYSSANQNKLECPDELLAIGNVQNEDQGQVDQDQKSANKDKDKLMSQEDLRKQALEVLTRKITTGSQNKVLQVPKAKQRQQQKKITKPEQIKQ
eukprot:TRINITY_DN304_c0_g1_i14.p1 TRINITY_DN304_c0_g1~~TRINITY_DN304_c0_g1_i14.p1  ORF type:complete len:563 (+),score=197.84 TRINITY_DN304_c0_g1_i14:535-2223(+)